MNVKDIEITPVNKRGKMYRMMEILPGFLSYSVLILPFLLSIYNVQLTAFLLIGYLMIWFIRAAALNLRVLQSYFLVKKHEALDWIELLDDIKTTSVGGKLPEWHYINKKRIRVSPNGIKYEQIVHAIIIAVYNEQKETIEQTVKYITESKLDCKRFVVTIAYEERGGKDVETQILELQKEYKKYFKDFLCVKHPDGLSGEVRGKGGNITFAGRELKKYFANNNIEPKNVIVTTLDSDNRPHQNYFANLTYAYLMSDDPKHLSYQPIAMFTNNIWDVPALMRVIATGNTYWMMVQSLRPHTLRNFASHAQSLEALIDTDFWSTRTIVEDGHQFWRTYFRYEGKHRVIALYMPIYQDAVLASGYVKTLKAQFIQLRRWAWGASDVSYFYEKAFMTKNSIPFGDKFTKFIRLVESHVSWATSPLILAFGSFIPPYFHNNDYLALSIPVVASRIQTVAMVGIIVTLVLSIKLLPKKPHYVSKWKSILMIFQWVLLPITTICYSSFAALYSQTRLMTGRYLGSFDVTEKAIKTKDGIKTSHKV